MSHSKYLIIGGGMTAASAMRGIRQVDNEGSIGMISQEEFAPYNRPPLSKGLWKGKPLDKIWRNVEQLGGTLYLGRTVISLDVQSRRAVDDQGETFTYEKLLLATGGTPRHLPFGESDILYYRTLGDYQRLRSLTESRHSFLVIGGGFIGSEIAAALASAGQDVAMIFPEVGIGALIFPPEVSLFLNDYYRQKGVRVLAEELITGMEKSGSQVALSTKSNHQVISDYAIAGIGIRPNTSLAEAAGLQTDNGILVDEFLRTSQEGVFAAGDVANFYNPLLDKRLRVEHEDNANHMGELAGKNMASMQPEPYNHLPFFYSDLFDLGYEAVGEMSSRLQTFTDWQEPYQKGVIYYLDGGRVRGVLLWNVWGQIEAARQLIGQPGPFEGKDLKGRLPA